MAVEKKRVFLAWQVDAPWPLTFPFGRVIHENGRHLTVAFLGQTDYKKIETLLPSFPLPPFSVGACGFFDHCLFLPERHPRVAAWHVHWLTRGEPMRLYYEQVMQWLHQHDISVDKRHGFMPHVTLARSPLRRSPWLHQFIPLPCTMSTLHLYESLGHSKYYSLWCHTLTTPFREIEHTADRAFIVCGTDYTELFFHGIGALASTFPPLLAFSPQNPCCENLEQVIQELNRLIARADQDIGCPFKAVSYHSHCETQKDVFHWEMIVDV